MKKSKRNLNKLSKKIKDLKGKLLGVNSQLDLKDKHTKSLVDQLNQKIDSLERALKDNSQSIEVEMDSKIKEVKNRYEDLKTNQVQSRRLSYLGLILSMLAILATWSTNCNRVEIAKKSGHFDKPKMKMFLGDLALDQSDTTTLIITSKRKFKNIDIVKLKLGVKNIGAKNLNKVEIITMYPNNIHRFCDFTFEDMFNSDTIPVHTQILDDDPHCITRSKIDKIKPANGFSVYNYFSSPKFLENGIEEFQVHPVSIQIGGDDYEKDIYYLKFYFMQYSNKEEWETYINSLLNPKHNFVTTAITNKNLELNTISGDSIMLTPLDYIKLK